MPETSAVDGLISSITETITATVIKKASSFSDTGGSSSSTNAARLFGREKPVHRVLGGGRSADVLLWRNKTISASFLTSATIVWVLFEWLNYHFLPLVLLLASIGLVVQFLWSATGVKTNAPRLVISEEMVVNIGRNACVQMNRVLQTLQEASCGGNFKQCLTIVVSMWAAAILASWCNLATVIYLGIVGAHTLPVIYEKYDDQIDDFVLQVFSQLKGQFSKIDSTLVKSTPREAAPSSKGIEPSASEVTETADVSLEKKVE